MRIDPASGNPRENSSGAPRQRVIGAFYVGGVCYPGTVRIDFRCRPEPPVHGMEEPPRLITEVDLPDPGPVVRRPPPPFVVGSSAPEKGHITKQQLAKARELMLKPKGL